MKHRIFCLPSAHCKAASWHHGESQQTQHWCSGGHRAAPGSGPLLDTAGGDTAVPGRSDSSCRPTPRVHPKTHSSDGPKPPDERCPNCYEFPKPLKAGSFASPPPPLPDPGCFPNGSVALQVGLLVLLQHLGPEGQQLQPKATQTGLNLLSLKAALSAHLFHFPPGSGNGDERMYAAAASMEKHSGCPVSGLCRRAVCCQHSQQGCAVMLKHSREPKSISAHSCLLPGEKKKKKEKATRL